MCSGAVEVGGVRRLTWSPDVVDDKRCPRCRMSDRAEMEEGTEGTESWMTRGASCSAPLAPRTG